jgi:hypothetical protein
VLEAQERKLLLDSLRPPDGYDLDCAVGTTFTLDLLALLTAPLGFTLFDLSGAPDGDLADNEPLVLLKAIRTYADRIALFCQAGRIAPPARRHPLFASLEGSVVEVNAPKEHGVFHPKVWVLRFSAPEQVVRYRVLCLTRNLTFDRCWDTVLALDGELQDRQRAIAVNHPLGDFVEALPGLAVRKPVSQRVTQIASRIADEVRRVAFELPEPFDVVDFWPMGLRNARTLPFDERVERMLVMSPFLSPEALARLTEEGRNHVLISRLDSLQALSKTQLRPFRRVFVMSPSASVETDVTDVARDPAIPSTGLHAKLFVADQGWDASVWTGSANATNAAFNHNVELVVQLIGPKSKCGVDAVLSRSNGNTSLRDLIEPYQPNEVPVLPDPVVTKLEDMLEAARRALGRARWITEVSRRPEGGVYQMRLSTTDALTLLDGTTVRCWPITVEEGLGRQLTIENGTAGCLFDALSLEALSAFVVFDVTVRHEREVASCRFVLNSSLSGEPAGRQDALLRNMLRDRRQVIRFLLLLLSDVDVDLLEPPIDSGRPSEGTWTGTIPFSEALLEPLIRALEREPERLDQIDSLIRDLEASDDADRLLPAGLRQIWPPIWEARQVLK